MHQVLIDGLGTAGDGIARLDSGQVVFVAGGLPGDLAEIRLTRKIKKVQHAEVVRIIEPSSQRVESRCKVEHCGGCAVRGFSAAGQAIEKRDRVVQALRRIAKQDIDDMLGPVVQVGDGWHYRHRVRLHAAWVDDRWFLGYYARGSHRLVALDKCPVLCPELEAFALTLTESLDGFGQYAAFREIEICYSRHDRRAAARLHAAAKLSVFRDASGWFEKTGLAGIDVVALDGIWQTGDMRLHFDHARADEFGLLCEPGVFTQANPSVNDLLVAAVVEVLPVADFPRVLELHAGVGNYSLPLALAGAEVYTAENMQEAVLLAQENGRLAGAELHAFYLDDLDALGDGSPVPPLTEYDAVLMNPPRVGAFNVAKKLAEAGPQRVAYVSCDPATLARDVQTMVAGGYSVTSVTAFDMFPQTPHVETLLILDRG